MDALKEKFEAFQVIGYTDEGVEEDAKENEEEEEEEEEEEKGLRGDGVDLRRGKVRGGITWWCTNSLSVVFIYDFSRRKMSSLPGAC